MTHSRPRQILRAGYGVLVRARQRMRELHICAAVALWVRVVGWGLTVGSWALGPVAREKRGWSERDVRGLEMPLESRLRRVAQFSGSLREKCAEKNFANFKK